MSLFPTDHIINLKECEKLEAYEVGEEIDISEFYEKSNLQSG